MAKKLPVKVSSVNIAKCGNKWYYIVKDNTGRSLLINNDGGVNQLSQYDTPIAIESYKEFMIVLLKGKNGPMEVPAIMTFGGEDGIGAEIITLPSCGKAVDLIVTEE